MEDWKASFIRFYHEAKQKAMSQVGDSDLPKVSQENGSSRVAYERPDDLDLMHPQEEGKNIARFVYRVAKFDPEVKVLNLTLRYIPNKDERTSGQGFEKQALIDDLEWIRGFKTKDEFAESYGKYFANVLFQQFVESYNRSLPGLLNSVATGEIDPSVSGQTREQFVAKARNLIPELMRETGLDPAEQPPLNRTAFTNSWHAMSQKSQDSATVNGWPATSQQETPLQTSTEPPEVRRALPANGMSAITPSEVASETIGQLARDGERYPQTRQRLLAIEDLNGLNAAEIRYAINEIYARHGASFPNHPDIQQQFKNFGFQTKILRGRVKPKY